MIIAKEITCVWNAQAKTIGSAVIVTSKAEFNKIVFVSFNGRSRISLK